MLNTAVVFCVFNRPDTTKLVWEAIRQAQPRKLLIVADGPRSGKTGEAERCEAVRHIVARPDWPCDVLRLYADANLGCRQRMASGITWAFQQVEEAIVLEDDCLPEPTFFRFCTELLEYYRNETRIMAISGDCFQPANTSQHSYYFSIFPHIWGWATWRRAWERYDLNMREWPNLRKSGWLKKLLGTPKAFTYWKRVFDIAAAGKINTWDVQWVFSCWRHNGLAVLPRTNLVRNIGFGAHATHTPAEDGFHCSRPSFPMPFPLRHPTVVEADTDADEHTQRQVYKVHRVGGPSDFIRRTWLKFTGPQAT